MVQGRWYLSNRAPRKAKFLPGAATDLAARDTAHHPRLLHTSARALERHAQFLTGTAVAMRQPLRIGRAHTHTARAREKAKKRRAANNQGGRRRRRPSFQQQWVVVVVALWKRSDGRGHFRCCFYGVLLRFVWCHRASTSRKSCAGEKEAWRHKGKPAVIVY